MVAPDTMNDLGMADSEELVEVFGFSGDRVELPEEAVIPYTFGQAASLSSSDLHRFRTHNTSIARAMGARLSLFVRAEFSMELEEVSTMTFQKFRETTPHSLSPCFVQD